MTPWLALVGGATVAWLVVLGALAAAQALPRFWFVVTHYTIDVWAFGLFAWFLFRAFGAITPFAGMAGTMAVILALEGIAWGLVSAQGRQYLTFTDWVVPAFLIASVVYLAGLAVRTPA